VEEDASIEAERADEAEVGDDAMCAYLGKEDCVLSYMKRLCPKLCSGGGGTTSQSGNTGNKSQSQSKSKSNGTCKDDSICFLYGKSDCGGSYMQTLCPKMCGGCGGTKTQKEIKEPRIEPKQPTQRTSIVVNKKVEEDASIEAERADEAEVGGIQKDQVREIHHFYKVLAIGCGSAIVILYALFRKEKNDDVYLSLLHEDINEL